MANLLPSRAAYKGRVPKKPHPFFPYFFFEISALKHENMRERANFKSICGKMALGFMAKKVTQRKLGYATVKRPAILSF